jgi:predicted nucleic acid-binding Zn ribbon protein
MCLSTVSCCLICGDSLSKLRSNIPGRRCCSEGCSKVALQKERDKQQQQALLVFPSESDCYYVPPKKNGDHSFNWSEDVLKAPHFTAASVSQFKHVRRRLLQRPWKEQMQWKDGDFGFILFYLLGTFGCTLG